jgi:hypothetical protein
MSEESFWVAMLYGGKKVRQILVEGLMLRVETEYRSR